MKARILLIFLFFFPIVISRYYPIGLAKPYWLKEGFSATYKIISTSILTEDFEATAHGWTGMAVRNANGTYRWEVKEMSGGYAEVGVNLDLTGKYWSYEHSGFVIGPWNRSATVEMDVDNRTVTLLNGTELGAIPYWIDPNVEKWDLVTIYGKPPYEVKATVMRWLYNPVKTPVGEFDCWQLYVEGKKRTDLGLKADTYLWYDKATGILVASFMKYYDVIMTSMGAVEVNLYSKEGKDFKAPSSFVLASMTTSSPSSPQFLNLSDYIPYIVAAVAVAAIPTAIYMTRRKRKKTPIAE
jgi:hypothetical protein